MSILTEDFHFEDRANVCGVVGSLENRMVDQVAGGWFDAKIFLDLLNEILERHVDNYPAYNTGDVKVSLWRSTAEINPFHGLAGDMLLIRVGDEQYALAPILRDPGEG